MKLSRIVRLVAVWLRNHGLAPFGYATEDFRMHHHLVRVWGPLLPARWEVYRWPVGTGSSDKDDAIKPLPPGTFDAHQRIGFSAERVYVGRNWNAARAALRGVYPDGATDITRKAAHA